MDAYATRNEKMRLASSWGFERYNCSHHSCDGFLNLKRRESVFWAKEIADI